MFQDLPGCILKAHIKNAISSFRVAVFIMSDDMFYTNKFKLYWNGTIPSVFGPRLVLFTYNDKIMDQVPSLYFIDLI